MERKTRLKKAIDDTQSHEDLDKLGGAGFKKFWRKTKRAAKGVVKTVEGVENAVNSAVADHLLGGLVDALPISEKDKTKAKKAIKTGAKISQNATLLGAARLAGNEAIKRS